MLIFNYQNIVNTMIVRGVNVFLTVLVAVLCFHACHNDVLKNLDEKYHLVSKAYNVTKHLFLEGRGSYNHLKNRSLYAIDTLLDLVKILNDEMAKDLRSAIIKFYKIKYFYDFTNYEVSMEEMVDIVEHCLIEPVEKLVSIREQFSNVIQNFRDARNFDVVEKCGDELPDEVAAAHCLLHQAVLFNQTMQESLVKIVEVKTRQHAQDMNSTLYGVQQCLNDFIPKFFDQLLVDTYTERCSYLRVVNASVGDFVLNKWRANETRFLRNWEPVLKILKNKSLNSTEPLYLTLNAVNLTSVGLMSTLY